MLLSAGGHALEYVWHGPSPDDAATLVFLHEGLGCVSAWRDFPERVAETTGCGVLVYSRAGYGNSDPATLPRPLNFMRDEALITLPRVLEATGVREHIIVGHSDGGSMALIYAAEGQIGELRGVVLEAPHIFVEASSLASIRRLVENYQEGPLRVALERHHGQNTDCAFWGWNRVWLDPAFRSWNIEESLSRINVPMLVIQGEQDEYGTLRQVEAIERGCGEQVRSVVLPSCGHSPHRDQPKRTLEEITSFINRTLTQYLLAALFVLQQMTGSATVSTSAHTSGRTPRIRSELSRTASQWSSVPAPLLRQAAPTRSVIKHS